ncbi:MAG TPA: VOC family protein [bacterium]|nr:VOC family protein [bacterium]
MRTLTLSAALLLALAIPALAEDSATSSASAVASPAAATADAPAPGKVTSIQYATIVVDDYDKAVEWYTTTLGMELHDNMPYGREARWVSVRVPGQDVAIVLHDPSKVEDMDDEEVTSKPVDNILLGTDDCKAIIEKIRAAGGTIEMEPEAQPWGTQAIFNDPWGNQYVIVQPAEMPAEG